MASGQKQRPGRTAGWGILLAIRTESQAMSASEQVHELVQWPDRLEPYLPVGDSLARVTDLAMRPYQAMVALNVLLAS